MFAPAPQHYTLKSPKKFQSISCASHVFRSMRLPNWLHRLAPKGRTARRSGPFARRLLGHIRQPSMKACRLGSIDLSRGERHPHFDILFDVPRAAIADKGAVWSSGKVCIISCILGFILVNPSPRFKRRAKPKALGLPDCPHVTGGLYLSSRGCAVRQEFIPRGLIDLKGSCHWPGSWAWSSRRPPTL